MTAVIEHLKAQGEKLFNRGALPALWQEIAENFYPERADFTATRYLGTDFASNLVTSYPMMLRRDLANTFSSMLRPTAKPWFKIQTEKADKVDIESRQYLEWLTGLLKKAMYDRKAKFVRATKEGDNDFATFGQCVISSEMHYPQDGSGEHLLHRCWHLRDCAWAEDVTGTVNTIFRKWDTAQYIDVVNMFPKTVHNDVRDQARTTPFKELKVQHIVMPSYVYNQLDGVEKEIRQPFVSIYFDTEHDVILECVGRWVFNYTVPRWATVSGSQYAHSPATIAALPDGRLIQSVSLVLLEAGEKATNPPLIAVEDAVRSDLATMAGGVTWVDIDYDEKMGEVLRPISQDTKGLQFGLEMVRDLRLQMKDQFFLDKLNLPPTQGGRDMTAYEVAQRIQEFIRNALPLFEPVEVDYNGQICEVDLQLLMRADPTIVQRMPEALRGRDYEFQFESPLRDAVEKAKVGQFQEAQQIIATAQAIDPSTVFIVKGKTMTREVLEATVPASWINSEEESDKLAGNAAAQAQQQQMLDMLGKGAAAAKDLGSAAVDAASTMEVVAP